MRHLHTSRRAMGKLELILLVALCGIVVAVALPQMQKTRLAGNEAAAAKALLAIASAQESFRDEAVVDQDADTVGEYGLLGELAGRLIPRSAEAAVDPAYVSKLIATGGAAGTDGCAVMQGYAFRIFLVKAVTEEQEIIAGDDKTLAGTSATPGVALTEVDPIDLQEKSYVLYAWPIEPGKTGALAYVVTHEPRVYATKMEKTPYSGRGPIGAANTPAVGAAFEGEPFTSKLDTGEHTGADGNTWFPTATLRR